MKLAVVLTLALALSAQADFSYKSTRKSGGAMAAVVGSQPGVSTYYYKGQKIKMDDGARAVVIDFGARTITTVDNNAKTVSVKGFDEAAGTQAGAPDVKIDVKETGARKTVNGFDAFEVVMTMQMESPSPRMGPMQMEMDMWLSSAVPGAEEMRAFHEKNASNFPWTAMSGGGNPQMQAAIAQAQKKMSTLKGVPVQQIIRVKSAGSGANTPGMSSSDAAQMQAGMAQARARLEAMKAQGGQQAAMAEQMLARLPGGAPGGGGGASAALIEITMDSSDFSPAPIPDSVFAIPADYKKIN